MGENKKWKQIPKHCSESRINHILRNNKTIGCGISLKYDRKENKLILK